MRFASVRKDCLPSRNLLNASSLDFLMMHNSVQSMPKEWLWCWKISSLPEELGMEADELNDDSSLSHHYGVCETFLRTTYNVFLSICFSLQLINMTRNYMVLAITQKHRHTKLFWLPYLIVGSLNISLFNYNDIVSLFLNYFVIRDLYLKVKHTIIESYNNFKIYYSFYYLFLA